MKRDAMNPPRPDLSVNHALLASLAETPFLYLPNPGNAGDSAIACATYRAFDQAGCRYTVIDAQAPVASTAGQTVVYGGGGNLVSLYPNARRFIEQHHRGARRLVLLPHTIDGHADLLSALGENVELYCREAESFAYASAQAPRAKVGLGHDMAFMFDMPAVLREGRARYWPVVSSPDLAWRNTKRWLRQARHALGGGNELQAFRHDSEKTDIAIPADNIDVSQAFATDGMSERLSDEATYRMARFLDRFTTVHTNRLHVCVVSALLGKTVHFHPNSYGKNRNVWRHSMQGVFANVVWHGQ